MTKNLKILNFIYYSFYVCYLCLIYVFGFAIDFEAVFEPNETTGVVIQNVVIWYVLASVPGALYGFKRMMHKVSQLPEEQRADAYVQWAVIRMAVVGFGAFLALPAFYLIGQQTSMLFAAGISLVALYFCKPTEKKMYMEMNDIREDDPRAGEIR